jgi:hypothetical protein
MHLEAVYIVEPRLHGNGNSTNFVIYVMTFVGLFTSWLENPWVGRFLDVSVRALAPMLESILRVALSRYWFTGTMP